MNSADSLAILDAILRREGRSFVQYVGEAFPWTTARDEQSVTQLQRVVAEDKAALVRLARFLDRHHHAIGPLESFPARWTSINFAALEHVLPHLVQAHKESITSLKRDLSWLTDPAARHEVEALLAAKGRHLQMLQGLTASHSQLTSTLR